MYQCERAGAGQNSSGEGPGGVWGTTYRATKQRRRGVPQWLEPVGLFWCQAGGLSVPERPCVWSAFALV